MISCQKLTVSVISFMPEALLGHQRVTTISEVTFSRRGSDFAYGDLSRVL